MINHYTLYRKLAARGKYVLALLLLGTLLSMPGSTVHSHSHASPTYSKQQQKETIVYITRTGKKYHRAGCRYLSQSQIKITKKEAIKNRYGACKVCKP